jgi:hypothetical protein
MYKKEITAASEIGKGYIAVDLDGTLAYYEQWRGPNHIGPPIKKMLRRVMAWLAEGIDVRIFTARVAPRDTGDHHEARAAIERWCDQWIGQRLPITHCKDLKMKQLWDDRAIQVIENTGERADGKEE